LMTHGPFRFHLWVGAIALGGLLPLWILAFGPFGPYSTGNAGIAGLFALVGLLIYEWCFVMAGQSVPNS